MNFSVGISKKTFFQIFCEAGNDSMKLFKFINLIITFSEFNSLDSYFLSHMPKFKGNFAMGENKCGTKFFPLKAKMMNLRVS